MKIGDPDGHGHFGVLDADEAGRLLCHECGEHWEHLATHVRGRHGTKAAAYREAHGLAATVPLVGAETQRKMREKFEANRALHIAMLENHRDPDKARRFSRSHTGKPWAPAVRAKAAAQSRARRGRPLTKEEAAWLAEANWDLQEWADRARVLLALDGVTSTSLSEVAGVNQSTVSQRLKRYPPLG